MGVPLACVRAASRALSASASRLGTPCTRAHLPLPLHRLSTRLPSSPAAWRSLHSTARAPASPPPREGSSDDAHGAQPAEHNAGPASTTSAPTDAPSSGAGEHTGAADGPAPAGAAPAGVPAGKRQVRKRKKRVIEPNDTVTDITFKYPPGSKAAEAYDALMDRVKTQRGPGGSLDDGSTHRPAQLRWWQSPVTVLVALVPLITFGLGVWQVRRLKWKLNLIEELEDKLLDDPLELPKNVNFKALDDFSFRLVAVRGRWDESGAMLFLGPRTRDSIKGYNVILPFIRVDDEGNEMPPVLVNRGWVSEDHFGKNEGQLNSTETRYAYTPERLYAMPEQLTPKEAAKRDPKQTWAQWLRGAKPTESQQQSSASKYETIITLLPRIYPTSTFTPSNEPEHNQWFSVDPRAMAVRLRETSSDPAVTQGVGILPVYLEEVYEGPMVDALHRVAEGYPLGKNKVIEIRNQHATYAFTWFSLSAFTAVAWFYMKASRYGRR